MNTANIQVRWTQEGDLCTFLSRHSQTNQPQPDAHGRINIVKCNGKRKLDARQYFGIHDV
jgi:hypothetical protein